MDTIALVDKVKNMSKDELTQIGYELFGGDIPMRPFILTMLDSALFDSLAVIIGCGFISKQYRDTDFYAAKSDELMLNSRYFDLFLELLNENDIDREVAMPMLFASYCDDSCQELKSWSKAMDVFLLREAFGDFDRTAMLIDKFDSTYKSYSALLEADRNKTADILLDKLIYGHGDNKSLIRKFLFNNKIDIIPILKNVFDNGKAKEREAVVRILMLYKNDLRAADILSDALKYDPSVTVRNLIASDRNLKCGAIDNTISPQDFFYNLMISGDAVSGKDFKCLLSDNDYESIATKLFFVDRTINPNEVFVVDNSSTYDLNNCSIDIGDDNLIGVLHPTELNSKNSYLRQLNISQPFEQIKREVYYISDEEKSYNFAPRFHGSIVSAAEFKRKLLDRGYKIIGSNDTCSKAGLIRGDILCVVEFSALDFSQNTSATVGDVRFYYYSDVIKLKGKIFTDGVMPLPPSAINERAYSEFILTLYEVIKSQ